MVLKDVLKGFCLNQEEWPQKQSRTTDDKRNPGVGVLRSMRSVNSNGESGRLQEETSRTPHVWSLLAPGSPLRKTQSLSKSQWQPF